MSKSVAGLQGKLLEVNVVGCRNLSNKEWFSRQDPFVIVEYANNRFRTRTDTDGGKNPTFNEKFQIALIEGLRELTVQVWNSNTVSADDHIGSTKILLDRVLTTGYDNTPWQLMSKYGKTSGEVNLILHFAGGGKKDEHHIAGHSVHPPAVVSHLPSAYPSAYPQFPGQYPPTPPAGYPPPPSAYPPAQGYPPVSASAYPAPPSGYPAPPPAGAYPAPTGYPAGYPPSGGYPPTAAPYPTPYAGTSGYPPVAPYPYPGERPQR